MVNLFIKNSVGIDIADRTIEIVELTGGGRIAQIKNINRIKFKAGIINNGRIVDKTKLQKIIKKLLQTAKPHPIKTKELFFAIPESQIYTHIFTYAPVNGALINDNKFTRQQSIEDEIKKTIPITADNLVYSYNILATTKDSIEILVMASRRDILEEWQGFFNNLKIKVKFDAEIFAARRAILEEKITQPVCLIDIGAVSTHLAIFDKHDLKMSYSFYKAGEYFNEELANSLHINLTRAAELKKEINLQMKNKNSIALTKILEPLVREIKKVLDFWENKSAATVERLILLGGSSQIKGLVDYLTTQFELPVELAKSTLQDKKNELLYLGAIGTALKGIDNKWKKDLSIILQKNKPVKSSVIKKQSAEKNISGDSAKSYKNKLIFLIVILILGVILVSGIWWYRNYQRVKSEDKRQQVQTELEYSYPKTLQLSIPVAVTEEEYTTDRVPGRLISDLQNDLKPTESLWPQALQQEPKQWLVYQPDIAQQLFITALDDKLVVDFILDNIEYLDVRPSDNSAIYFISGKINFSVKSNIDLQPQIKTPIVVEVVPPPEKVTIIDTPTGWLNVRQGPDTSYPIVAKVDVGEEFILLEEREDWLKIEISSELSGWVFAQYVEKSL